MCFVIASPVVYSTASLSSKIGYTCGDDCTTACATSLAAKAMSVSDKKETNYEQVTLDDGYMEFHIDMNSYLVALSVNLGKSCRFYCSSRISLLKELINSCR
jgi:hypothetical protein